MKRMIVIMIATMLSSVAIPEMNGQSKVANVLKEVRIDQRLNERVPLGLKFRNEEEKDVRLGEFFGEKPVVLALVYYSCPMLCNQVLNGMLLSFQNMEFTVGNEFDVLVVSIDPTETAELATTKKKAYVEKYNRKGAGNGWRFLTGNQSSIDSLAGAVGFRYSYDPETKLYAHAGGIMVLTPEGILSRYFYGIGYPSRDLTFALIEASSNRIGSPADKLLLLCYNYDPMTGTYGIIITKTLRFAAGVTLFLLGGFVVMMIRRERREKMRLASRT